MRICGAKTVWGEESEDWKPTDSDGNVHMIPCFELDPLHLDHEACWCSPELVGWDEADDCGVYSHRKMH